MFVLICIHILYLQNIVVFSCDGLAGHLWEDFLTCAGNGINWVQYWGHDRRKLQRRKSKKHQFTQHFYQKVISCRLCAEKLAFQKQKFDDESAVYRLKKKSVRFDFSCAPAWSQHCHNIVPAYLCVRQKSAHLLVSPRQQHTGVLAKSLILIFYEGTQRQALEYLPCKSTAYYINYSAGK